MGQNSTLLTLSPSVAHSFLLELAARDLDRARKRRHLGVAARYSRSAQPASADVLMQIQPHSNVFRRLVLASGLFDQDWYLRHNRDVESSGLGPLEHFLKSGDAEARSPGPTFNSELYLKQRPDVAAAGFPPFFHFLIHGLGELSADQLERDYEDKRAEIENQTHERLEMEAQLSKLTAEQARMAAERDAAMLDRDRIGQERADIALQLSVVQIDHQRAVRNNDEVLGLYRDACAKLAAHETELSALSADRDRIVAGHEAALRDCDRLQQDRSSLQQRLSALEADYDRVVTERDSARGDVSRVEQQRANLESQIATLDAEHQRAVRNNEEMRARCGRIESERLALENQLSINQSQERIASEKRLSSVICETLNRSIEQSTSIIQFGQGSMLDGAIAQSRLDYAKLMGRLSTVAADLSDVRRAFRKSRDFEQRPDVIRQMYLDMLENALTGQLYGDPSIAPWNAEKFDPEIRAIGRDWPSQASTMIGTARMRNVRLLVETALADGVAGDLLEAGVWRGGASIYMRGILAAHGVTDRKVWVADSFAGLPVPEPELYPEDDGDLHSTVKELAVSLEDVKKNFAAFDLLDNQVVFAPGWFKDTLHRLPLKTLAVLRLDGDMYSSTMQTLDALYSKVSTGGFIIIDDYVLPACRKATDDFREKMAILEPLEDVDGAAAFWRRDR